MNPTSTWKSIERELARQFGTERLGPTGEHTPDFLFRMGQNVCVMVEVKHRKKLPALLTSSMKQVLESVLPHYGVPATRYLHSVILHQHGGPVSESLVLLTLSDYKYLVTERGKEEGA